MPMISKQKGKTKAVEIDSNGKLERINISEAILANDNKNVNGSTRKTKKETKNEKIKEQSEKQNINIRNFDYPLNKLMQLLKKKQYENIIYLVPVFDDEGILINYKVDCSLLAEYIRHQYNYIFMKTTAKAEPQRFLYITKQGLYKHISDEEFKGYIKHLIPLELQKMRDIAEVLGLIYTDLKFYSYNDINADENIINFKNGVLHLDTMELKKHSPKYLSTIQIDCNYNPDARPDENSTFNYFMDFFTDGKKGIQKLLLQYMGLIISNISVEKVKKSLFIVGETDAGKTQLKNLTEMLIGANNCTGVELETLEERFGTSNLFNKRLAGSGDLSYMRIKELKQFKKSTGGDKLNAEFKGENSFEFVFKGFYWFCCNKLPKFGGDKGDAVFNRIIVVRADKVPEKKNKNLLNEMYKEREYITLILVQAIKEVIKNNYDLNIPLECETELKEYKKDVNTILRFVDDCTEPRPKKTNNSFDYSDGCSIKKMFDIYVAWCKDNNNGYSEPKQDFENTILISQNTKASVSNGYKFFQDVRITSQAKNEYGNYKNGFETIEKVAENEQKSIENTFKTQKREQIKIV